ncbi:hypothetical protein BGZ60DRAFT_394510 [Tricladium varicosporioides]|nr:hypothetical protein BGZ60DRAFT_394510 [Hymenoscyphus varicosporioides]
MLLEMRLSGHTSICIKFPSHFSLLSCCNNPSTYETIPVLMVTGPLLFTIIVINNTMWYKTLNKPSQMRSLLLLGLLHQCTVQAQRTYDCESSFNIPHLMVSVLVTESPILSQEMLLPLFHSCDDFKPGATAGGNTIAAGGKLGIPTRGKSILYPADAYGLSNRRGELISDPQELDAFFKAFARTTNFPADTNIKALTVDTILSGVYCVVKYEDNMTRTVTADDRQRVGTPILLFEHGSPIASWTCSVRILRDSIKRDSEGKSRRRMRERSGRDNV